jgi:aryl-alcohol dehydrogenase-like predicted oxidoreductase
MAVRIVLGTANFGTNYGFLGRNSSGPRVDLRTATEIISMCAELGIREIDTALTYGPSQSWIGEIKASRDFLINSKIPWVGLHEESLYQNQLNQIKQELKSRTLNLVQWHNWDHSSGEKSEYLEMQSRLNPDSRFAFGVTTYGPESVINALTLASFEAIQFEANILNQAPLKAFNQTKGLSETKPYLRSTLLQGVLSDADIDADIANMPIYPKITNVRTVAATWSMSTQELAIRSLLNMVNECAIVLGVESANQLVSMHEIIQRGPLPDEMFSIITNLDASSDPNVDPRKW